MPKLCRLLIIGIFTAILIVGCNSSPNFPTSDRSIPNSESCRLVSHEMGETKVCGQPQKVVALSPHILDSMLALGAQPVAYAEATNLNLQTYDDPAKQIPYIGKWVTTKPVGLGDRKNPDLERLALIKPDLILGEKWLHKEEYPLLSQIAPTLLFSDEQPDGIQTWQQDINGIAQALDKTDRAEQISIAFDRQIAEARTALQPVLQKYPRVFLLGSNLTTSAYSQPESTTGRLLTEIGFEIVQPPGTQGDAEVSWEIVPQIETDLILVLSWNNDSFNNPEAILREKWANNTLLNSMPVFQEGRVYFVDYQLWGSNIRGPLTDKLILEALPDLLLNSLEEKNSA